VSRRLKRGESPAEFAAREVRREHRPPRSWPPALGGLLVIGSLGLWAAGVELPDWGERARIGAFWAGIAVAALGLLICRGWERLMSAFLLAAVGLLALATFKI